MPFYFQFTLTEKLDTVKNILCISDDDNNNNDNFLMLLLLYNINSGNHKKSFLKK